MAGKGAHSDRLPPYASYSTWQRLIESLRHFLPSEIDRSFYDHNAFSGSQILTLKGTLRFLDLMDHNNVPTEKLRRLAQSGSDKQKDILKDIVQEAYAPLFDSLNLQTTTMGQLLGYFESAGAKGDIKRKCSSFFLTIASEAGIGLSPHLSGRSKLGTGRKSAVLKARERRRLEEKSPLRNPEPINKSSWAELVLNKFPELNPAWPDEVKKKWFEDFRELLSIGSSRAEQAEP